MFSNDDAVKEELLPAHEEQPTDQVEEDSPTGSVFRTLGTNEGFRKSLKEARQQALKNM